MLNGPLNLAEFCSPGGGIEDAGSRSAPDAGAVVRLQMNDDVDTKLEGANVPAKQMLQDAGANRDVALFHRRGSGGVKTKQSS